MKRNSMLGVFTAIGVGVGTAFFAATSQPFWIAVGAGVGVAIGAAMDQRKGKD